MRHRKAGRRLVRTSEQRLALMRSLVTALVRHERIKTTDARAKELRKLADQMVTLGKRGDLHARRQAARYIQNGELLAKLFDEIAPRFSQRAGGYTRVLKLGNRKGDNAPVSIIEYLAEDRVATPEKEEEAAAE